MLKLHERYGKKYIKIKGEYYPIIELKGTTDITTIYNYTVLRISKMGKVLNKIPLTTHKQTYFKHDVCHRPDIFLKNGRNCNPCDHITYCHALINVEGHKMLEYLTKHEKISFYNLDGIKN